MKRPERQIPLINKPSFAPNGSSQMTGQVKKRVDPKFFDPEKRAQCFLWASFFNQIHGVLWRDL